MERRKGLVCMAVVLLTLTGIYGLGKLSFWLYNGKAEQDFITTNSLHSRQEQKAQPYKHAIVRQVVKPQAVVGQILKHPTSLKEVLAQVTVNLNSFKRNFTGNMQDIELVLNNKSSYLIDRLEIELEFLDEKDELISKKTLPVDQVKPASNTVLKVPGCKRSVNVRLRVLNIYMPDKSLVPRLT
jgi:hypothetical protein